MFSVRPRLRWTRGTSHISFRGKKTLLIHLQADEGAAIAELRRRCNAWITDWYARPDTGAMDLGMGSNGWGPQQAPHDESRLQPESAAPWRDAVDLKLDMRADIHFHVIAVDSTCDEFVNSSTQTPILGLSGPTIKR